VSWEIRDVGNLDVRSSLVSREKDCLGLPLIDMAGQIQNDS